jgi:predicted amidohydrolase
VGRHSNGRETHGDSMIVGPWGEVLGRLTRGPGFVIAGIDREHMQRVRSALPSIEHRKSSHVGKPAKGTRLSA